MAVLGAPDGSSGRVRKVRVSHAFYWLREPQHSGFVLGLGSPVVARLRRDDLYVVPVHHGGYDGLDGFVACSFLSAPGRGELAHRITQARIMTTTIAMAMFRQRGSTYLPSLDDTFRAAIEEMTATRPDQRLTSSSVMKPLASK